MNIPEGMTLEVTSSERIWGDGVWPDGTMRYGIRLSYEGRTMGLPFNMGPALSEPPTIDHVVESLMLDATTDPEDLELTPSQEAQLIRQTERFFRLLGVRTEDEAMALVGEPW